MDAKRDLQRDSRRYVMGLAGVHIAERISAAFAYDMRGFLAHYD
jgi:hypothetical protein